MKIGFFSWKNTDLSKTNGQNEKQPTKPDVPQNKDKKDLMTEFYNENKNELLLAANSSIEFGSEFLNEDNFSYNTFKKYFKHVTNHYITDFQGSQEYQIIPGLKKNVNETDEEYSRFGL